MIILSTDFPQTLALPAGQALTIVAASGDVGTATRLRLPGAGDPYSPTAISGADVTFGPYAATESFSINCDTGSFDVSAGVPDPFAVHPALAAYSATAAIVNALAVLHLYGAGAPVDYTDGTPPATGEGTAPKGAIYSDTTNGFVYRNSGTQAEPIWTKLADAV